MITSISLYISASLRRFIESDPEIRFGDCFLAAMEFYKSTLMMLTMNLDSEKKIEGYVLDDIYFALGNAARAKMVFDLSPQSNNIIIRLEFFQKGVHTPFYIVVSEVDQEGKITVLEVYGQPKI